MAETRAGMEEADNLQRGLEKISVTKCVLARFLPTFGHHIAQHSIWFPILQRLTVEAVDYKARDAIPEAGVIAMSSLDSLYVKALDIFETGGTLGVSKDSLDSLPLLKIASENIVDCFRETMVCSVSLQTNLSSTEPPYHRSSVGFCRRWILPAIDRAMAINSRSTNVDDDDDDDAGLSSSIGHSSFIPLKVSISNLRQTNDVG
ncbi:hypothetical protein KSP40_PGU014386 [Platanthera guangdongensis]|uniref:Uncharacterized protein n=1 Tax=Platanthera guangdongensis TaxID=2320717 RepID=A0ABR2LEN8_9ASPA